MKRRLRTLVRVIYRKYRDLWLLFGCVLAMVMTLFAIVLPWKEEAVAQRQALERAGNVLRGEIGQTEVALGRIDRDEDEFNRLLENGWLAVQDRLAAARLIEQLGSEYKLARLDYQFQPERRFTLNDARLRGVNFVETRIQLGFNATLDTDLVQMLARLQTDLGGSVDIERAGLTRLRELDLADLLALEAGEHVPLIEGSVSLVWRTLVIDGVPPFGSPTPAREDGAVGMLQQGSRS